MLRLLPIVSLALLGSCATMQDALKSKDQGATEVYPVPEEIAWEIARRVFVWEEAESVDEYRENQTLVGAAGAANYS